MRRSLRNRLVLAFAFLGVGTSCSGATAPAILDGALTVDKAQYSISAASVYHTVVIQYTFVNRSSTTLYIQRNCQNDVDWSFMRQGGVPVNGGYDGKICAFSVIVDPPIAVAPGATRTETVQVMAVGDPHEPIANFTGAFQFTLRISVSANGGNVVPYALRSSALLTIVAT